MPKIYLPANLTKFIGASELDVEGNTIQEIIDSLEESCPGFQQRICSKDGEISRFVNVFINEEDIRFLEGRNSILKNDDEISIVAAMSGG